MLLLFTPPMRGQRQETTTCPECSPAGIVAEVVMAWPAVPGGFGYPVWVPRPRLPNALRVQIPVKVSEATAAQIDAARGSASAPEWVRAAIDAALGRTHVHQCACGARWEGPPASPEARASISPQDAPASEPSRARAPTPARPAMPAMAAPAPQDAPALQPATAHRARRAGTRTIQDCLAEHKPAVIDGTCVRCGITA